MVVRGLLFRRRLRR